MDPRSSPWGTGSGWFWWFSAAYRGAGGAGGGAKGLLHALLAPSPHHDLSSSVTTGHPAWTTTKSNPTAPWRDTTASAPPSTAPSRYSRAMSRAGTWSPCPSPVPHPHPLSSQLQNLGFFPVEGVTIKLTVPVATRAGNRLLLLTEFVVDQVGRGGVRPPKIQVGGAPFSVSSPPVLAAVRTPVLKSWLVP